MSLQTGRTRRGVRVSWTLWTFRSPGCRGVPAVTWRGGNHTPNRKSVHGLDDAMRYRPWPGKRTAWLGFEKQKRKEANHGSSGHFFPARLTDDKNSTKRKVGICLWSSGVWEGKTTERISDRHWSLSIVISFIFFRGCTGRGRGYRKAAGGVWVWMVGRVWFGRPCVCFFLFC